MITCQQASLNGYLDVFRACGKYQLKDVAIPFRINTALSQAACRNSFKDREQVFERGKGRLTEAVCNKISSGEPMN